MTAWTNISNALVAVGAKPFATTIQAFRDNVIAAFEGDTTATAAGVVLKLTALEILSPGAVIRSRNDSTVSLAQIQSGVTAHSFEFMQRGQVRMTCIFASTNGAIGRLGLFRNGVFTTLTSFGASGSYSLDVSVVPGDRISFSLDATGGSQTSSLSFCRIQTNGSYLWPGSAQRLENGL